MTAPAAAVLLVVPSAEDRPWNRRLVTIAGRLADRPGGVHVLAWHSGPLVAALAEVAPVTDAGVVNTWGPARALSRARLTPAARLAKNRHLRSLLAPLATVPGVLVGDPAGLDALDWLPGAHRTAVLVPPGAAVGSAPMGAVDLVVAPDPHTHRLLREDAGVPVDHLRGLALLDEGPAVPAAAGAVGLVGWSAPAVGRILAELGPARPDHDVVWFTDPEAAWSLWQGPTASPFAPRLHTVDPHPTRAAVAGLALLLATGDDPGTLAVVAAAAALGVPVVHHHGPDVDAALTTARARLDEPAPGTTGWTIGLDEGLEVLLDELAGSPGRTDRA